jgi:hypothetical protein
MKNIFYEEDLLDNIDELSLKFRNMLLQNATEKAISRSDVNSKRICVTNKDLNLEDRMNDFMNNLHDLINEK